MTNSELIQHLIKRGMLKSENIIEAFSKIDRINFVRPNYSHKAYGDYPLPIGKDQTISQPTTVAFMLELLKPEKGEKILDVGSGSGWTTALLTHLVGDKGSVFGTEIVPELVKFGSENIKKYKFSNASIQSAKDTLGLQNKAPFDKMLVSAAANEIPQELLNQLKVGGRLVIPVKNSIWKVDKAGEDEYKKSEIHGFVFVPLISN